MQNNTLQKNKMEEKDTVDYIYIDANNKVHILVPVVGVQTIGTDNTCQTFREMQLFCKATQRNISDIIYRISSALSSLHKSVPNQPEATSTVSHQIALQTEDINNQIKTALFSSKETFKSTIEDIIKNYQPEVTPEQQAQIVNACSEFYAQCGAETEIARYIVALQNDIKTLQNSPESALLLKQKQERLTQLEIYLPMIREIATKCNATYPHSLPKGMKDNIGTSNLVSIGLAPLHEDNVLNLKPYLFNFLRQKESNQHLFLEAEQTPEPVRPIYPDNALLNEFKYRDYSLSVTMRHGWRISGIEINDFIYLEDDLPTPSIKIPGHDIPKLYEIIYQHYQDRFLNTDIPPICPTNDGLDAIHRMIKIIIPEDPADQKESIIQFNHMLSKQMRALNYSEFLEKITDLEKKQAIQAAWAIHDPIYQSYQEAMLQYKLKIEQQPLKFSEALRHDIKTKTWPSVYENFIANPIKDLPDYVSTGKDEAKNFNQYLDMIRERINKSLLVLNDQYEIVKSASNEDINIDRPLQEPNTNYKHDYAYYNILMLDDLDFSKSITAKTMATIMLQYSNYNQEAAFWRLKLNAFEKSALNGPDQFAIAIQFFLATINIHAYEQDCFKNNKKTNIGLLLEQNIPLRTAVLTALLASAVPGGDIAIAILQCINDHADEFNLTKPFTAEQMQAITQQFNTFLPNKAECLHYDEFAFLLTETSGYFFTHRNRISLDMYQFLQKELPDNTYYNAKTLPTTYPENTPTILPNTNNIGGIAVDDFMKQQLQNMKKDTDQAQHLQQF